MMSDRKDGLMAIRRELEKQEATLQERHSAMRRRGIELHVPHESMARLEAICAVDDLGPPPNLPSARVLIGTRC